MSTASEHDATATFDPPGTCSCCQQQMLVLQNWIRLGHEQSKSKKYIDDIEKSLISEDELWSGMKPIFILFSEFPDSKFKPTMPREIILNA